MVSAFAGCDTGSEEQRADTVQLAVYHYPLSINIKKERIHLNR